MKKPTLNIAVTGLNAIDSPGPGVSVIRALKEAESFDVVITGLSYESLEPGIYMHDLVHKTYSIPYPAAGIDNLMARLEYIHEQEHLDVIIPNFDAELYPFIKLEPRLKTMGIHMFLPTLEQFEERHKVNLNDFGEKYSINIPKSKVLYDLNTIHSLVSEFSFPVLVKGKYYDAMVAYSVEQVKSCFNKISAKWGLPIIIQEFIHGTEFNVTGLGDGKGNTIAAVPMRKQYITDKGKAWGGISISDEKMLEMTRKFLANTKWRGGFELELMKNKDGQLYLLEINPRLPAWIYLAVGVGQNIPESLVNLALGNPVTPYESYTVGKMFIRYSWDMIVDREEFEQISMYGEL
ncbi:MAG TPA: ATP-grasp domain-containing protein [Bacteroidales bacterium]|nr:ATP-grasp domain-containing protein [Bacteroidales bacterium]HPS61769.1 ATP-grasp domain-containing protein [Bacteroidales bacterium]